MVRRRVGSYPDEFKRMVVERMKECDNVQALSAELDLDRRMMYRWREQFARDHKGEWRPPQKAWESTLRRELSETKRVLADKTLELDFFKSALFKVNQVQQQRTATGDTASTTPSARGRKSKAV